MAGFFNRYSEVGPGVDKDEKPKNRFILFFSLYFRKLWKLIALNLLYILCCIPISTIGAATAGFVFVLRKFSEEKSVFLLSDFFTAVKKNWKQASIMYLIEIVFGGIISFAVFFYYENLELSVLSYIGLGFCITVLVVFAVSNFYTYLMIVSTNLSMKNIIKNSIILAFAGGKSNLITILGMAVFIAPIALFFPITIVFVLLFGFSTVGFIIVFNSYVNILKYVINPYYEKNGALVEEKTAEEQIFTDIGTKEIPVKTQKKSGFKKGRGRKIT